jgi:hypothetical protein
MFTLADIKQSIQGPPRLLIYGVPGIGKTTFAASMPNPVFLPIEDGLGQISVPAFPRPASFVEVLGMLETLLNDDHQFQTVVMDSLDSLEPLVWEHVLETVPAAAGRAATRIEDYGYGKGYLHAMTEWRKIRDMLDALRVQKGMAICGIAHSAVVKVELPDCDPFDRYQMRLHKTAEAMFCDWADVVAFANYKMTTVSAGEGRKRGVGSGERILHTTERPAWRAKNRYKMPDTLPMDWAAVEPFIVGQTND